jgi:hypothetical protein
MKRSMTKLLENTQFYFILIFFNSLLLYPTRKWRGAWTLRERELTQEGGMGRGLVSQEGTNKQLTADGGESNIPMEERRQTRGARCDKEDSSSCTEYVIVVNTNRLSCTAKVL